MAKVIETLKKNDDKFETSMIYMSDHGESLGENGVYLHGLPYAIAPAQQTHVPFIAWFSDKARAAQKLDQKCLENIAQSKAISHDNLPYTLLGMLDVQTSIYKPDMDIFASCRR